ncbi:MAG: hypothetical protein R3C11_26000 [Planctomycetaceae bacterium]
MSRHGTLFLFTTSFLLIGLNQLLAEEPSYQAELVFPYHPQHNHAPGLVECPNGDLLISWFRGSGNALRTMCRSWGLDAKWVLPPGQILFQ